MGMGTGRYTNTPWDNHFKGTDPFLVTARTPGLTKTAGP